MEPIRVLGELIHRHADQVFSGLMKIRTMPDEEEAMSILIQKIYEIKLIAHDMRREDNVKNP